MTVVEKYTGELLDYLREKYGDRLLGTQFIFEQENTGFIEGVIDQCIFQIRCIANRIYINTGYPNIIDDELISIMSDFLGDNLVKKETIFPSYKDGVSRYLFHLRESINNMDIVKKEAK